MADASHSACSLYGLDAHWEKTAPRRDRPGQPQTQKPDQRPVKMEKHGDLEEEYLTCYICYEVFTEPKTLVCLHRFCERCLQGYLAGLAETARKKGFPCPVCRELNPAPDPRRPAADWASLLRTDFHLKSLIKALKSATYGQGTRRGRASGNPQACALHEDKDQDLYCVDCSRSICHLCAGISHRACSQVITLSEAAADHRATLDLQHQQLATRLGSLAQLRVQIDSAMDHLGDQHRQAEASIRQCSQAAMEAIRLQEKQQLQELQKTFRNLKADVAKRLALLDNKMASCQQLLDTLQTKMKSATDAEVIQQASSLLHDNTLDVDDKKVHNILVRLKSIRLEFHPTTQQAITLGEISLSLAPQENPPPKIPSTSSSDSAKTRSLLKPPVVPRRQRSQTLAAMETTHETPHVTQTPVKLRTIPGKFREDQCSPKLRDVLVLPAQKMVLVTDWANQCVKAFHERRERDSRLALGGKPWCLTGVTDTLVAVSVPVSSQICVLKVTPRLALQSSFFAQKRYSGLAALNSDTLVASGGSDPPCVDIINLGGEVLRSFSHDVTTGRELFQYPSYIAMMPDKKCFLVSDRRRAAVICLNTSGQVQFTVQPEGGKRLQEPNGVKMDRTGAIYLAEARGVVKVTPQGQLDRVLLQTSQDGLENPRGLDLDEEGLLYVSSREEEVVVFKMI